MTDFNQYTDVIDSRDFIARIEELEANIENTEYTISESFLSAIINGDSSGLNEDDQAALSEFYRKADLARPAEYNGHWSSDSDESPSFDTCEICGLKANCVTLTWVEMGSSMEREELSELRRIAAECESVDDWIHGEALIRDRYFEMYIEELIDDCYEMPKEMNSGQWPWRHMTLDIKAAAEEAKTDYMDVQFFGHTYWIRSV